ncbi:MAG: hypothetical protein K6A94_12025 [Bacteroidales bacterium]|nr:hypothetical protein [Bacteroidales bacterium]
MNEQIAILLENYKDGVPVKIERSSIIMLAAVELAVVALGAMIVKIVKDL